MSDDLKLYSLAGLMIHEAGRTIDLQLFNGTAWVRTEDEARGAFIREMMNVHPTHRVSNVQCAEVKNARYRP